VSFYDLLRLFNAFEYTCDAVAR